MMLLYLSMVLVKLIDVYSFLIIAYVLLSWVPGAYDSWIGKILNAVVTPVTKPLRRLNLQFAGFDFSFLLFIWFLDFLKQLIINLWV